MIAIESVLYGVIGGLVGAKIFLLGLAAVFFIYTLTEHKPQRKVASLRVPARRPGPDLHA
jgi:hypothetical protein